MDPVFDPRTGKMVDPQTGLPVSGNYQPPPRVNTFDQMFNGTGIPERINAGHSLFNPVVALGESGQHTQNMLSPGRAPWERVSDLGKAMTGMAGTVAPMMMAARGALPTTNALVDAMSGVSLPGGEFLADEFGGVKMPGKDGITAYQGSPHNFAAERLVRYPDGRTEYIVGKPDILPDIPQGASVVQDYPLGRMRMDKIGTGEGAQAYGHGLYAAENEGVAKGYRDTLSGGNVEARNFFKDGEIVPDIGAVWQSSYDAAKNAVPMRSDAARAIAGQVQDWVSAGKKPETFLKFNQPPAGYEDAYKAAVDAWSGVNYKKNPGSMYEVRINANPDDFLDWDKPLDEYRRYEIAQPFRGGMNPMHDELADLIEYNDGMTGREARQWIGNSLEKGYVPEGVFNDPSGPFAVQADEYLREAGIPGIKYLDAGSRGAGDGSRNYVVFDENLIEIVKKYGIAGAAAMLGMSAADLESRMGKPKMTPGGLGVGG